jgi:hypothetical protein
VLASLLAGMLFTGPAGAQWAVIDAGAISVAEGGFAKAAAEYAEQAKRWLETLEQYREQIAHYQQMMASVMSISFSGMTISNKLSRIDDPSSFVAQACPGSGDLASTALDLVGLSSLDFNGNIAQSQRQICQRITLLQIDKYNKTADMLNKMNQYGSLFQQIDQLRAALGSINAIGNLQANSNEVARSGFKLTGDVENWRAQMTADDAAIQTLHGQQTLLANLALKGTNASGTVGAVIGNVIQGGAFAAAFSD